MAENTSNVDSLDIQITATANKAISALETLSKRLEKVAESLRATQAALEGQTKAQEDANAAEKEGAEETESVVKETKKMTAATQKSVGALSKLAKAFGRIMLYRAIRTIIKNIGAAIKEGLTNLKAYSEEVGTEFAPAVDNLRRHVMLLKNAFATALRPVIEALIPVIIKIVDWLAKMADFVAQVMSVLTGKVDNNGRYTKAILADLEQSNKEAKELRRTLLGFDEINRLDGDTGSGNAQSAGLMFQQADVSDNANKVAEVIKNIIEKVKEISKAVSQFIAENPWVLDLVFGLIAAFKVLKTFKTVLSPILKVVKAIGIKGAIIIALIAAMALWGDKIKKWLDEVAEKSRSFFGGELGEIIGTTLETIGLISDTIYKLFHGDLKGAGENAKKILKNILKIIAGLVIGAINIVLDIFSDLVNAIAHAWTWLHNEVFAPLVNWFATVLAKARVWFHNALIDVRIAFQSLAKWLMEKLNAWVLQPLTDDINGVIDFINRVFGENIEPIDLTVDTSKFDAKIEELEAMKLPPITETVEVVGKWREPSKLRLHIDTQAVYNAIDRIGEKVNRLGNAVSSVATAIAVTSGSDVHSRFNIQKYASGGFPAVGSLFIAGERGAEYVTSWGGQSAVYNTDEMERALYRAVSAALANMPSGGGDIYLDGEVIYKSVVRRNNNQVRSTGRAALLT